MGRCFIIQPFDSGTFDRRCDETYAPAIREAGLEPYRIDWDPSVVIPIERIESEIRDSVACFAEITTNNPNVWFEVGYAIALGKPLLPVCCTTERTELFPFDVRHRNILTYQSASAGDFTRLAEGITIRIKALLANNATLQSVVNTIETEGLTPQEMATLVSVMQNQTDPDQGVSTYLIETDMENAGFNKLALSLSLRSLVTRQMIRRGSQEDFSDQPYTAYFIEPLGEQWLLRNIDKLQLRASRPHPAISDDIPF